MYYQTSPAGVKLKGLPEVQLISWLFKKKKRHNKKQSQEIVQEKYLHKFKDVHVLHN